MPSARRRFCDCKPRVLLVSGRVVVWQVWLIPRMHGLETHQPDSVVLRDCVHVLYCTACTLRDVLFLPARCAMAWRTQEEIESRREARACGSRVEHWQGVLRVPCAEKEAFVCDVWSEQVGRGVRGARVSRARRRSRWRHKRTLFWRRLCYCWALLCIVDEGCSCIHGSA